MTYIESYKIPWGDGQRNAAISKENDGFKPWLGGCGISPSFKTIQEARDFLFRYIQSSIKSEIQLKENI